MGFFAKLGTIFKSNLNDLISKAEDPEKMLNQVLIDMRQQLGEAKKQVAVAIADEKRLKKQADEEAARVADWERKAMTAVRAGDDDLARQALVRKAEYAETSTTFAQQWENQRVSVERLKEALRTLNNKIEEAKRKKNILVARKKRAEAHKAIHNTMAGLNDASAFETFDRMANKIDQLEAEAEASEEVAGELASGSLESKFAALEAHEASNDRALLELKAKMGLLPGATADGQDALPPGEGAEAPQAATDPAAAVDSELEALKSQLDKAEDKQ